MPPWRVPIEESIAFSRDLIDDCHRLQLRESEPNRPERDQDMGRAPLGAVYSYTHRRV